MPVLMHKSVTQGTMPTSTEAGKKKYFKNTDTNFNRAGKLEYKDVESPAMQKGHALFRIKRVGICGTDLHAYEGTQPYFNYPRILGHELAAGNCWYRCSRFFQTVNW